MKEPGETAGLLIIVSNASLGVLVDLGEWGQATKVVQQVESGLRNRDGLPKADVVKYLYFSGRSAKGVMLGFIFIIISLLRLNGRWMARIGSVE